MTVVRPLPGISFEVQAAPLADALPRMDIPIFVGFAASGPLHVPVAVEDAAQFAMLFGGDVELPAPPRASEPRIANLAPTVGAFFRNGGRRCWIVRVASTSATSNRFAVPALFSVTPDGEIEQAYAWARSEGSWSDGLAVHTNLDAHVLQLRSYDHAAGSIDIAMASSSEAEAGDLLRLTWSGSTVALFLFVSGATRVAASDRGVAGILRVRGKSLWLERVQASPLDDEATWSPTAKPAAAPQSPPTLERLTFDLTVRGENDRPCRLRGLGFMPEHARFAGALPTDATLFADVTQFASDTRPRYRPPKQISFPVNYTGTTLAPPGGWPGLWESAAQPRFPLAFNVGEGAAYIPLEMTATLSEAATAEPMSASTLERDGLDDFGTGLFLDEHLGDASVRDLLDRADAVRSVAGLELKGIHAALAVEEATILSAPDAVHRGWFRDAGNATDSPAASPLVAAEAPADRRQSPECCRKGPFDDCQSPEEIAAPLLTATSPQGGTYQLNWDPSTRSSVEVQEATRSDFSDAATILTDAADGPLTIYGRAASTYFYRARRISGPGTSNWSVPVTVRVTSVAGWIADDDDGSEVSSAVPVHRAMLRLCAARSDLVAILSLPRDYDDRAAIAHASKLVAGVEPETLSYGALWHPWLIGRHEEAGPLRTIPPDGATAGVMAARAIARGAWVAPANEPLRGVVALTPEIVSRAHQALQDGGVNLVRRATNGFVCLDADTLGTDPDLRALNVRRLLILVRRAAVRTGNDYTFEPNSPSLRNAIKRGMEAMLAGMMARGAFAGRNAQSSFRVTTDETVNTAASVDAGRLIAEIRIAPSRPLSFLTIRLVQRGEAAVAQEVR